MKEMNLARVFIGTAVILSVPLLAMLISDEVDWGLFDFVVIGALLMIAGLTYEYLKLKVAKENRLVIAVVLATVFFLIYAELAVGIFGSPFAGS